MEGTPWAAADAARRLFSAGGVRSACKEWISTILGTLSSRNKEGLLERDGMHLTKQCRSILTTRLAILILVSIRNFSPCLFKGRNRR